MEQLPLPGFDTSDVRPAGELEALRQQVEELSYALHLNDQMRGQLAENLVAIAARAKTAEDRLKRYELVVERALAWNRDPNRVNNCFALAEACDKYVAGEPS